MGAALDALMTHNRRLVEAIDADAGADRLDPLLSERRPLIDALIDAAAAAEPLSAAEIQALEQQEAQVVASLRSRREAVSQELALLRRGRSAQSAYRPGRGESARFVDRAG
jgi:hypothetical protein